MNDMTYSRSRKSTTTARQDLIEEAGHGTMVVPVFFLEKSVSNTFDWVGFPSVRAIVVKAQYTVVLQSRCNTEGSWLESLCLALYKSTTTAANHLIAGKTQTKTLGFLNTAQSH